MGGDPKRPRAFPCARQDYSGPARVGDGRKESRAVDFAHGAAISGRGVSKVAKGQEKPNKTNKPKVSTKDKQAKKAEKKAAAR